MRSFTLASAFALAVVPFTMADPVAPSQYTRFNSLALRDLFIGVASSPVARPGSPLTLTAPGDGNLTVFSISRPGEGGVQTQIQLLQAPRVAPLCVTAAGANETAAHVATLDLCNEDDPKQIWSISELGVTTISNTDRQCLSTLVGGGLPVYVVPCRSPVPTEQLWNTIFV